MSDSDSRSISAEMSDTAAFRDALAQAQAAIADLEEAMARIDGVEITVAIGQDD